MDMALKTEIDLFKRPCICQRDQTTNIFLKKSSIMINQILQLVNLLKNKIACLGTGKCTNKANPKQVRGLYDGQVV